MFGLWLADRNWHRFMEWCFEMKLNVFDRERGGPEALHPPSFTSGWSFSPSWKWSSNLALLHDRPSPAFLTSWRVPGNFVHIKAIKVSSSTVGLNQVRMFMENLWIVHFLPSFWQSRLPLKSLHLYHLKWQTSVQKTQGGHFLSLLLEYSSTHLHMDLRTICFLTRFTVQYGTVGQKAENKNALSHYTTPALLFFND